MYQNQPLERKCTGCYLKRYGLNILLKDNLFVFGETITVGHLSDTEDLKYIKKIAEYGCFIGCDRLYNNTNEEYINRKVYNIKFLCKNGYMNKILLSQSRKPYAITANYVL